jgi:hypothetical protein
MKLLISLFITNSLFVASCATTSDNSKSDVTSKQTIDESNPAGVDTTRSYLPDQDEKKAFKSSVQPEKKPLKSR